MKKFLGFILAACISFNSIAAETPTNTFHVWYMNFFNSYDVTSDVGEESILINGVPMGTAPQDWKKWDDFPDEGFVPEAGTANFSVLTSSGKLIYTLSIENVAEASGFGIAYSGGKRIVVIAGSAALSSRVGIVGVPAVSTFDAATGKRYARLSFPAVDGEYLLNVKLGAVGKFLSKTDDSLRVVYGKSYCDGGVWTGETKTAYYNLRTGNQIGSTQFRSFPVPGASPCT